MGVTNYDNLPEQAVETTMRRIAQTAKERKGKQRTGGASSRFFTSENPGQFDWSGKLSTPDPQSPTFGIKQFLVTLTAERVNFLQDDLVKEVYVSSDSGATWKRHTYKDATKLVPPYAFYGASRYPTTVNDLHISKWLLSFDGPLNTWVAFKLQVIADDRVSISMVALS